MRVMADLQERVSERIVEQTVGNPKPAVDAPVPQAMEGIVEGDVASAPAVTNAAPSTVSDYVDPVPPDTHATPAPVTEHVASARDGHLRSTNASEWIRGSCTSSYLCGNQQCGRALL